MAGATAWEAVAAIGGPVGSVLGVFMGYVLARHGQADDTRLARIERALEAHGDKLDDCRERIVGVESVLRWLHPELADPAKRATRT